MLKRKDVHSLHGIVRVRTVNGCCSYMCSFTIRRGGCVGRGGSGKCVSDGAIGQATAGCDSFVSSAAQEAIDGC